MYEQEKQRLTHLTILMCYTILTLVLSVEAFLMKWDMSAVVLLLLGILLNWWVHITEKIPSQTKLWLYFGLSMLAFFYYGIHETSMYDIAMVMIVIMVIYSVAEMNSIINCCMATYYLTMGYDLLVVTNGATQWNLLNITRIMLHLCMVYVAGHMIKLVLQRRNKEKMIAEVKIGELEEVHKRTEEFLTNVSHELRTPINAVTGITTVMIKNEENPHKRRDILSIQTAGQRLFQQIEDILDYTEIDTGRLTVSEDSYMISSVINDIITEIRLKERENIPEVVFDVDAGMPALLIGDGRKVKKIIRHLLANAIRFTKSGGVYVRIYAIRKPYGINLCIKVRDTGIGVDEEQIQKIKERFYQSVDGKSRKSGGLGLGLPIVYGMTSVMDGFVQMESTVGEGTVVSVSIPQKIANDAPCMSINHPENLCLACFLRPEKYTSPEVRDYYNETIQHMVQELDLTLHRISSLEDLNKLISIYHLTHLFVGKEEYAENAAYLEKLDADINVIVFADNEFEVPVNSRITLIRKPFYCLSLVNILNASVSEEEEFFREKHILCPGIRVLVVDDEPMNLMVAEGIFKEYRMQVTTADSGRRAIELCETEEFDLVFLDHMMPEMDGVETLKLLRKLSAESDKKLTVIAFTANAVSGAREMFRKEGFDEFVSKPVEDMELERVLRKVLPKSALVLMDDNGRISGSTADMVGEEFDSYEFKMESLETLGIQTQLGLNYCRGDVSFYMELLKRFVKESETKTIELNHYYAEKELENYRIYVHALKSTSKMIGADRFSEMARNMEEAAKKKELNYILEHHEEMMEQYQWLIDGISSILRAGDESDAQTSGEESEVSGEELLLVLGALKDCLDTFETDKAEAIFMEQKGKSYQGKALDVLLCEIREYTDNFECDKAVEKLLEITKNIEGGMA